MGNKIFSHGCTYLPGTYNSYSYRYAPPFLSAACCTKWKGCIIKMIQFSSEILFVKILTYGIGDGKGISWELCLYRRLSPAIPTDMLRFLLLGRFIEMLSTRKLESIVGSSLNIYPPLSTFLIQTHL